MRGERALRRRPARLDAAASAEPRSVAGPSGNAESERYGPRPPPPTATDKTGGGGLPAISPAFNPPAQTLDSALEGPRASPLQGMQSSATTRFRIS